MPAREPVPTPTTTSDPADGRAPRFGSLALAVLLWAALVVVSLALRPLLPVDETRYASVAWEMWRSGDLLVPHMNGLPYSDKPPLVFWSIQGVWAAFGVHAWAARLVPALFGLGTLFLVAGISRELWPERPAVAARAPLVLAGLLLWAGFTGALMFDLPLAFFVAAAVRALLAARRRPAAGWTLFAVALGLGILTKGPVALVPTLAVALTAPWWWSAPPRRPGGWRWFGGVAAGTAGAALLALAWALPAAAAGGPGYAAALLVGQTRGRVIDAFAHGRPWWWYLPLVPFALYPYSFWPPLWRAVRSAMGSARTVGGGGAERRPDSGLRLTAVWFVVSFAVLSAVSGKQIHYLLPLFPAVALAAARLLDERPAVGRADLLGPLALPAALAVGAACLPWIRGRWRLAAGVSEVPAWSGLAVALAVAAALALVAPRLERRPALLSLAGVALVCAVGLALHGVFRSAFDVEPMARRVQALEVAGTPVAFAGDYAAEFNFAGRLEKPVEVIPLRAAGDWLAGHPDGRVAGTRAATPLPGLAEAEQTQPYRADTLTLWRAPAPQR